MSRNHVGSRLETATFGDGDHDWLIGFVTVLFMEFANYLSTVKDG